MFVTQPIPSWDCGLLEMLWSAPDITSGCPRRLAVWAQGRMAAVGTGIWTIRGSLLMSRLDDDRFSDPQTWNQQAWGNVESNLVFLAQTGLLAAKPKILEIGCGKGALLSLLRRQNYHALGCDHALEVLRSAAEPLPVVAADGDSLPFGNGSFDLVLSFDVFEHIPDTDGHLREVCRVLRPGGSYAFQTPNILTNVPFEILRTSIRFGVRNIMWSFRPPQHCALHSFWKLRRRLERSGFETEFYSVPVVNEFFRSKVRRYAGKAGAVALRLVNPDRLPLPIRTNFFVTARRPS
jgi:SAM-dependent methyltransferase